MVRMPAFQRMGANEMRSVKSFLHVPSTATTIEHAKSPPDVHFNIGCHAFVRPKVYQRPAG